jgi:hypothetical protein
MQIYSMILRGEANLKEIFSKVYEGYSLKSEHIQPDKPSEHSSIHARWAFHFGIYKVE